MDNGSPLVSRKTVLRTALVAVPAALVATPALARTRGATLEPTPMCDDGDDPTPPQMEGHTSSRTPRSARTSCRRARPGCG